MASSFNAQRACGGGGAAPENIAPVASAGLAQSVAFGSTVTLDGAGTDANSDLLTYSWKLTAPAGSKALLNSATTAKPTFVADTEGIYTAILTVSDGRVVSSASSVTVTASANPNAVPFVVPTAGDWVVYAAESITSSPTGTPPLSSSTVTAIDVVNSDGSYSYTNTSAYYSSTTFSLLTNVLSDINGKSISYVSAASQCTYSSPWTTIPYKMLVGDVFSFNVTNTCQPFPSGTPAVTDIVISGVVQAQEFITINIGKFDTIRYTYDIVYTGDTINQRTSSTNWVDKATGRAVKILSNTVVTSITGTKTISSRTQEMVAYSLKGKPSVGAAVSRFAGNWNINFASGNTVLKCSNIIIDANGSISGGVCNGVKPTNILGSVSSTGQMVLSISGTIDTNYETINGNGNLSSPSAGAGTYTRTNQTGSWTASHK